jgi:hypothetical protein
MFGRSFSRKIWEKLFQDRLHSDELPISYATDPKQSGKNFQLIPVEPIKR